MGFPMSLFQSVYDSGWPYSAAWAMVVANIIWVGVAGTVLAVVGDIMAGKNEAAA